MLIKLSILCLSWVWGAVIIISGSEIWWVTNSLSFCLFEDALLLTVVCAGYSILVDKCALPHWMFQRNFCLTWTVSHDKYYVLPIILWFIYLFEKSITQRRKGLCHEVLHMLLHSARWPRLSWSEARCQKLDLGLPYWWQGSKHFWNDSWIYFLSGSNSCWFYMRNQSDLIQLLISHVTVLRNQFADWVPVSRI